VNREGRLGDLFPGALVGVALIFALLIVVTPVLTASVQPAAGSIFTQAELIVDGVVGNATTHFYVRGFGTTARYDEIQIAFAFGFNWTGRFPSGPLNWTDAQNASDVLSIDAAVSADPVAVNVSALYSASGVSALYVGTFAMYVGIPVGSTTDTLTVVSNTPGIASFTWPVASLPALIALSHVSSGGTS
jgi:hypothetical protein